MRVWQGHRSRGDTAWVGVFRGHLARSRCNAEGVCHTVIRVAKKRPPWWPWPWNPQHESHDWGGASRLTKSKLLALYKEAESIMFTPPVSMVIGRVDLQFTRKGVSGSWLNSISFWPGRFKTSLRELLYWLIKWKYLILEEDQICGYWGIVNNYFLYLNI